MKSEPHLPTVQLAVAEIFGELAEFWGFPRSAGRIYGLLYVSSRPLEQATIREELSLSLGTASTSLQTLLSWQVIEQHGRHYVARTDLFRMVRHVLGRRERALLERMYAQLMQLSQLTRESSQLAPGDAAFVRGRISHLLSVFQVARSLLDALAGGHPVARILRNLATRTAKAPSLAPPYDTPDV